MKSLKQFLIVLGLMVGAISLFSFASVPAFASLQGDEQNLVDGLNPNQDLRTTVGVLVKYVLSFLGLIAVVFIIYGGFLYVTSAGEDDAVGKAKNIIKNAVIGIIIIAVSYVIVNAVFQAAQGTTA